MLVPQFAQHFALGLLALGALTTLMCAGVAVQAGGHQRVPGLGSADGEFHELLQCSEERKSRKPMTTARDAEADRAVVVGTAVYAAQPAMAPGGAPKRLQMSKPATCRVQMRTREVQRAVGTTRWKAGNDMGRVGIGLGVEDRGFVRSRPGSDLKHLRK